MPASPGDESEDEDEAINSLQGHETERRQFTERVLDSHHFCDQ
jgi:hypothetical protein